MDKPEEGTETDAPLKAVSKIFGVLVWNKIIPPCYCAWIGENLKKQIWQLRAIPFKPIVCSSRIENNGFVDVRHYDCGFQTALGSGIMGFRGRHIRKGEHNNLHQVIHRLHDMGVDFDNIVIEEWCYGYEVDILAEIGEDAQCIAVELGTVSKLGKLSLPDSENIKELWFGDTEKFIYSLSRKVPLTEQIAHNEGDKDILHFVKYYKEHCIAKRQLYYCLSSNYAWNCVEIRELAQKELGLPYLDMDGKASP